MNDYYNGNCFDWDDFLYDEGYYNDNDDLEYEPIERDEP